MSFRQIQLNSTSGTLSFGLELEDGNPLHHSILDFLNRGSLYEPDISLFLARVIGAGDVVVDVGANIGFFSVLAGALTGKTGRVFAFEPGPNNLPELKHNLAQNGFSHVQVIEQPVSNQVGPISFFINSDTGGGNALWDPGEYPGNERSKAQPIKLTIESTTLDLLSARLPPATHVKLIKIDTEGAEYHVLAGATAFLRRHMVPFVICELHEFGLRKLGTSTAALRELMHSLGYGCYVLVADGTLPRFVPLRTEIQVKYIHNVVFTRPEYLEPYYPAEFFA